MGCYWKIDGNVVAKKESIDNVVNVLENYGIEIVDKENEWIWFSFCDYEGYCMPDELDYDLRPLVEEGAFTAKGDEDIGTLCYKYGEKPYYEEEVVLKYYPSHIDYFVKKLPKDLVAAVLRAYARPVVNIPESKEEEHNGANI